MMEVEDGPELVLLVNQQRLSPQLHRALRAAASVRATCCGGRDAAALASDFRDHGWLTAANTARWTPSTDPWSLEYAVAGMMDRAPTLCARVRVPTG